MSQLVGFFKTKIFIGLVTFVTGFILGPLLPFVSKTSETNLQYLYDVGNQIIENVDKCSDDKAIQNEITREALRALVERDKEGFIQLMKYCEGKAKEGKSNNKNTFSSHTNDKYQESTPKPTSPHSNKKITKGSLAVVVSSSKSDFKDYSDFKKTKELFLLIKPKKAIDQLWVDWDDGKGLSTSELEAYGRDKEHFFTGHYYTPGRAVRNITIVADYKDGSQEKIEKTIFTYF